MEARVIFGFSRTSPPIPGEPRRYRIEISLSGLIGLGAIILFGLVWVFILGVLVGRGYRPEQPAPQLERITPLESAANATPANATVLRPEELQFFDKLKDQPTNQLAPAEPSSAPKPAPKPTPTPEPPAPQTPATPEPSAAPEPDAQPMTPKPAEQPVAIEQPAEPAPATQVETSAPAEGSFNYVYQTASFRDPAMANQLKERIEALGFKAEIETSMQGSGSWRRVNVHFTGRPEDTDLLKEKLATLGLSKPLLRSKVPATP